jgi:hypothetical protein
MLCPNCQAELRDGSAFCGICGAALSQPSDVTAELSAPDADPPASPAPPVAPTAPLPPSAVSPPAYAAPAAVQPGAPAAYDPAAAYAQAPQPPAKRKTGLIIAIVAVILLVLCGCTIGGLFAFTPLFRSEVSTPEPDIGVIEPEPGAEPGTAEPIGYASADEAVYAALDGEGLSDWVYQVYDDTGDTVVFWAGPPASEWALEITVSRASDGTWEVVELLGLDFGSDVGGDLSPTDQAIDVVGQHLYAVKEDRGLDAQSFTVDPFRSDPASAQEAAGALSSFEVSEAREQSDGSFWVRTVQNWAGGQEQWEYWVVPTEMGYAIADMRPW